MTTLEELAKMDVGGNFLRFDNGWEFTFQIVDFEPNEVEKEYQGKKAGIKHQWRIILKEIEIQNQKIVDYKQEINNEKYLKIITQEKNTSYILELPKGATKTLSQFCLDNKVKTNTLIAFYRTGDKSNTEYHFNIVIQEVKTTK